MDTIGNQTFGEDTGGKLTIATRYVVNDGLHSYTFPTREEAELYVKFQENDRLKRMLERRRKLAAEISRGKLGAGSRIRRCIETLRETRDGDGKWLAEKWNYELHVLLGVSSTQVDPAMAEKWRRVLVRVAKFRLERAIDAHRRLRAELASLQGELRAAAPVEGFSYGGETGLFAHSREPGSATQAIGHQQVNGKEA